MFQTHVNSTNVSQNMMFDSCYALEMLELDRFHSLTLNGMILVGIFLYNELSESAFRVIEWARITEIGLGKCTRYCQDHA